MLSPRSASEIAESLHAIAIFGSLADMKRGDLMGCASTQRSKGNPPMRSSEDLAARQLEALSSFLAFTPRDRSLSLSAQIASRR